jgi:hypothetical protein
LGIGWGIGYGRNQENTEVYMAMYSFQNKGGFGWYGMSLNAPISISKISENPMLAQSSATPDIPAMWTPIKNEMSGNKMRA